LFVTPSWGAIMPLILTPVRSGDMPKPQHLSLIEPIPSEEFDSEVSLQGYEILSYPADFTLEVLVGKWKKKEINIPPLQRRFIWSQVRASKLIESFLMGLPVPPVFFYQERGTNKLLVVDGQQRLRSIVYFFSGKFGEPNSKEGEVPFNLTGLAERSPYLDATYQKLKDHNEEAFNKLNNSVLRSFVVKQIDPQDDTSIFQIFERLNTGGVILQGQEIRNCIYDGSFNDSLNELNKYAPWRKIFGSIAEDKRKRDVELILRFLALFYTRKTYQKPMKQFLNTFMKVNRRSAPDKIQEFENLFKKTCDAVKEALGEKPFHIHTGLNAAVYDSIFTVFASNLATFAEDYSTDKARNKLRERFEELTKTPAYVKLTSTGTTDEDIIPKRIKKAEQALFG
jgi:uncharacterized protein with ParB-like and HNH nuclease domain